MMPSITVAMRTAVLALYTEARPSCGWYTLALCENAGLLSLDVMARHPLEDAHLAYALTPAGILLAREEAAKLAKKREARREGARARADMMRSLGLTRTRSGAWE